MIDIGDQRHYNIYIFTHIYSYNFVSVSLKEEIMQNINEYLYRFFNQRPTINQEKHFM